jgi:hypothetical protein
MQKRRLLLGAVVLVVLAGTALWLGSRTSTAAPNVLKRCRERKFPARSLTDKKKAIELRPYRSPPTFVLALADRQTTHGYVSLTPKGGRVLRDRVSAQVIERPRQGSTPIAAFIRVAAVPNAGGSIITLRACIERRKLLRAGTYQGTVRIYGPRIGQLDYPLIITEKWPWWIAAVLMALAGGSFVFLALATRSLTFSGTGWRTAGVSILGLLIGLGAMVPSFFGAYWTNNTWGADPATNITGLVTAGFTAAVGGLVFVDLLDKKGLFPG